MAPRFKLTPPVVRETPIHQQIASILTLELARPGKVSRRGVVWWSVDMAAYTGNSPGIRTSRGCIAGVPDIVIVWQGHAHFVEVKAEDGIVSLDQQSVATAVLIAGAEWGTARDADEALALVDTWGIPRNHKVRVAA